MSGTNLINEAMNSEEIKRLLEKYYEGETTSGEELLLKKFFSMDNVPQDLRSDQEIFRYYIHAAEIPEPSADFEKKIISAIDSEVKNSGGFKEKKTVCHFIGDSSLNDYSRGLIFLFLQTGQNHGIHILIPKWPMQKL